MHEFQKVAVIGSRIYRPADGGADRQSRHPKFSGLTQKKMWSAPSLPELSTLPNPIWMVSFRKSYPADRW